MCAVPSKDPARIAHMFDAISPRYDLLNHLLSAGLDRRWRRTAIAVLRLTGRERLLDLCTGTADLAITATRTSPWGGRAIGVDFAGAMLALGRRKTRARGLDRRISFVRGDATTIPVRDQAVDAATVAFGIRNVHAPDLALAELARVLRPGGRLAILEFGLPRIRGVRHLYLWYFRRVLPAIGRLVSRHRDAYSYLPESVGVFPEPAAFVAALARAGLAGAEARPLTFGIVYLYLARKPGSALES